MGKYFKLYFLFSGNSQKCKLNAVSYLLEIIRSGNNLFLNDRDSDVFRHTVTCFSTIIKS